jgi:hypothetical protein
MASWDIYWNTFGFVREVSALVQQRDQFHLIILFAIAVCSNFPGEIS